MTMKKLLESFDRINTEAAEPTNTDGYFAGYGSTHNELHGKPQPKNPHQPGTNAYKRWEDDEWQGRRDRRQEMGESDIDEARAKKPTAFKIDILQGARSMLAAALKKLGMFIESQGYSGGSTQWSVAVMNGKYKSVEQFETALRAAMGSAEDDEGYGATGMGNWEGWLDVSEYSFDESVDEAVNHLGDKEYTSFNSWKSACKKAGAEWIDGDRDIANAMKGPRPYVRGQTHQVGEWDGEVGSVYSNVTESVPWEERGQTDPDDSYDPFDAEDPAPMVGEGEEQIDEISGKTLGSYIQKARVDAKGRLAHARELDNDPKVVTDREKIKGWYDDRRYTKQGASVHRSKIDKARANIEARKKKIDPNYPDSANAHRRFKGIEKAVDKLQRGNLTDSVNQIEEADAAPEASNAALLAKLSKVIQSCQTVDQLMSAEKFAKRVEREIGERVRNKHGFSGYGRVTDVMADITYDIRRKAEELGVVFESKVNEISQKTKDKYVTKAVDDHGHHAFMARNTNKQDEKKAFGDRADKRAKGINRALGGEKTNETVVTEKSTSEKQARFMAAAAHDPKFANKAGIDQSVAKEFNKADTGTKQLSNAMKESRRDPLGAWMVVKDGKSKKYLTRDGAKKAVAKDGGKLMSAEAWHDSQKKEKAAVAESKVGSGVTVILNEGVKFRVSNPALAKILRRFPHEAENFNQGGDLADDLYDELYDYYAGNGEMPYGTMKARTGDPYEWVSQRLAREMDAAQTDMFEGEEGSELEVITRRFPHEVKNFKEGGELDDDLYNALFDYYSDNAEIPYGIAKARTGDPFQWVSDRFCQDLGCDANVQTGQIEESPYPTFVGDGEAVDESLLMELSVEDQMRITDELQEMGLDEGLDFFFEGGHLVVIGRSTARLAINKVGGHIQSVDGEEVRIGPAPKERPVPARQDVNQLATVDDGIEEAVDDFDQRKGSKAFARVDELQSAIDGMERERAEWLRRGYDTSELDMDIANYKSEIEELLSGIEPSVGLGESAAVTIQSDSDEELINVIRKLSGMEPMEQQASASTIAVVEPEVEVEEAVETPEDDTYCNEPNPSIHTSTEKMMTSGDDLNRIKRQYPQAANPAANPMAESRALIKSYEDLLKGLKK